MSSELADRNVEPRVELMSELPRVYGNRSQLQEVVSNILVNALEAMGTTYSRNRVLRVRTELRGNTVAVLVQARQHIYCVCFDEAALDGIRISHQPNDH